MGVAILFKFAFSCFQVLAWPLLSMVYPLYASIEAVERNSLSDALKLITYWICFAEILLFEYFASVLLEWVPFWGYVKLSVICCLVARRFDGSLYVYTKVIRPVLFKDLYNWYKNLKEHFSRFLLDPRNCLGEIEADPTSPSSKDTKVTETTTDISLDKVEDRESQHSSTFDQASQGSKKVKIAMSRQPNVVYQTERNAAVEQTENVEARETIADASLESNEIEDEKDSYVEYQIECKEAAAVERIENERDGPTEQVTEIATDISLNEVEDRESQHSSSFEKIQKEWTCEVCEVKTSSESHLRSHIRGKLHKEVCKILSQSTAGEQWTCSICQTMITTRKGIIQHLRGARHNANRMLLKTDQPIIIIPHGYAVGNTSNVLEKVQRNGRQGTAKSWPNEMKNYHWWCTLCNVSCSSKGNMDSHLNGSKHLAKIQELNGEASNS